ncbi:hypothetical protein PN36_14505 [Candidatus Thiomargarita nelsonii]|uniref:Uncharacterized protein n=1 Tax=Candidatus Thiomargarita nelsonii TaxID=1003181 RepID=A0A0A6PJH6_9GAMM|nr:hypothetical protein PN36_14505 [Candidatus Thiomargarita nelsonii]
MKANKNPVDLAKMSQNSTVKIKGFFREKDLFEHEEFVEFPLVPAQIQCHIVSGNHFVGAIPCGCPPLHNLTVCRGNPLWLPSARYGIAAQIGLFVEQLKLGHHKKK